MTFDVNAYWNTIEDENLVGEDAGHGASSLSVGDANRAQWLV